MGFLIKSIRKLKVFGKQSFLKTNACGSAGTDGTHWQFNPPKNQVALPIKLADNTSAKTKSEMI